MACYDSVPTFRETSLLSADTFEDLTEHLAEQAFIKIRNTGLLIMGSIAALLIVVHLLSRKSS